MKKVEKTTGKGKSLIRALVRRGSVKSKTGHVGEERIREHSICERCGAIYAKRTWRKGRRLAVALASGPTWTVCPACRQKSREEYLGRIRLRGLAGGEEESLVRRRVRNLERRARFTQPERQLVSMEAAGDEIEILTTSQKLAHRVGREIEKLLGGRIRYHWDEEDGCLLGTWRRAAKR
jgi:NMD protein affecting ribosome stability and mRNA decay